LFNVKIIPEGPGAEIFKLAQCRNQRLPSNAEAALIIGQRLDRAAVLTLKKVMYMIFHIYLSKIRE
jgi:hypothetical protein